MAYRHGMARLTFSLRHVFPVELKSPQWSFVRPYNERFDEPLSTIHLRPLSTD